MEAPAEAPASADAKVADGEENAPAETDLDKLLQPALGDPLRDRTRGSSPRPSRCASASPTATPASATPRRPPVPSSPPCTRGGPTRARSTRPRCGSSLNLKDPKNPDLRRMVGDGHITPQALLDYSPEQLASNARRDDNAKIREHAERSRERTAKRRRARMRSSAASANSASARVISCRPGQRTSP